MPWAKALALEFTLSFHYAGYPGLSEEYIGRRMLPDYLLISESNFGQQRKTERNETDVLCEDRAHGG